MKKLPLLIALMLAFAVAMVPQPKSARADDFIDLDLSQVAPVFRGTFRRAERFWESRVRGYSASLPAAIRRQITGRLSITASIGVVDGFGGTLGFAGPTQTAQTFETIGNPLNGRFRLTTVPVAGQMVFDIADVTAFDLETVVRHEMAHVLGIGTMWEQNGIVNQAGTERGLLQNRRGLFQYIGRNGIRGFRNESGHHGANYVPTENGGGAGTALGHWAANNWFFDGPRRAELMLGAISDKPQFVSQATIMALQDTGMETVFSNGATVLDTNSPVLGGGVNDPFPKGTRGFSRNFNLVAVPEPSSLSVLGLGLFGLLVRRKRS